MHSSNFAITKVDINESGKVICTLGFSDDEDTSIYEAELEHFAGFCSIPANPTSNNFASATINTANSVLKITSFDDNRNRDIIKTINPGESILYSLAGTTVLRLRENEIDIELNSGNKIKIDSNGITIDGNVTINSSSVKINGNCEINGGESLLKKSEFETFLTDYKAHIHKAVDPNSTTDPSSYIKLLIGTRKLTAL